MCFLFKYTCVSYFLLRNMLYDVLCTNIRHRVYCSFHTCNCCITIVIDLACIITVYEVLPQM